MNTEWHEKYYKCYCKPCRERRGDYLGETVQVIPHITDEIKRRIKWLRVKMLKKEKKENQKNVRKKSLMVGKTWI